MFDCIIIGGGPAGLTCAIYLARFNRNVIVIENGKYRNYYSQGIHGFLGYDGVKPMTLIRCARKEAAGYGVKFQRSTVTKLSEKNEYFEVNCRAEVFRSKIVVLAYGVRDILPEVRGIKKYYGRSIHHCPVCDGYEIRNKKVGLLGSPENSLNMASELKHWTQDLTILSNGVEINSRIKNKLNKSSIGFIEKKLIRAEGNGKSLKNIILSGGEKINFDALFFYSEVRSSCNIHEDIKLMTDKDSKIRVNRKMETSVNGIFAIGDITAGPQLVIAACADGAIAAIEINKKLNL